jgi:hypothetical protein
VSGGRPERVHAIRQSQGVPERRKEIEGVTSAAGNSGPHVVALGGRWQTARPQQRAHVFEGDLADQILDRIASNNELTAIAVDVAQFGFGDDNPLQTCLSAGHVDLGLHHNGHEGHEGQNLNGHLCVHGVLSG